MDPELLEKAIIDRKAKTGKYPKAIIPVALYGMPYRIDRIMAVADKYGIPVIEDAAGVLRIPDSPVTDCQPNDNVEALRVYLDNAGIEARPLWKPMHKQPVYVGADVYTNGVEVELFKVGMCLPSGPCVSDEDVAYIVDCIKRACRIDG